MLQFARYPFLGVPVLDRVRKGRFFVSVGSFDADVAMPVRLSLYVIIAADSGYCLQRSCNLLWGDIGKALFA